MDIFTLKYGILKGYIVVVLHRKKKMTIHINL